MQDADDAKVGVLEESVHNPHETREDADTSVEGSHEDRDIAGTLMIRQDESSFAQTWRYFIPDFYNWNKNEKIGLSIAKMINDI